MKLVSMNCPNCNARLEVDMDRKQAFCQYCGNALLIDDEVQRTEVDITESSGYNFEKGRERARREAELEARQLAAKKAREDAARKRMAYEQQQRQLEEQRRQEEEKRRKRQEYEIAHAPEIAQKRCRIGLILGIVSSCVGALAVLVSAAATLLIGGEAISVPGFAAYLTVGIDIPAFILSIRGAKVKNGANPLLKFAAFFFIAMGPLLALTAFIVFLVIANS